MPNPIHITLRPEHESFIDAEVRSGRFASAEHVVAEALSRLMQSPEEEIDDEAYAALRRSEEQLARGEGRAVDEIRDALRSKYARG